MSVTINGTTGVSLVQDGAITSANLPAGSVLQVVQGTPVTSQVTTSSTSFADSGVSATITPSSASSKILVLAVLNEVNKGTADNSILAKLVRSSTDIASMSAGWTLYTASTQWIGVGSIQISYLDSPATTSATTYKIQIRANQSGSSVRFSSDGAYSLIVLMEIAG